MKTYFLLLLLIGFNFSFAQEWIRPFKEAEEAYKQKDYPHFYAKMKEANHLHPYHQGLWYQLGVAAALNNKEKEAIVCLKKAILINADFKLEGVPDLQSLTKNKEWSRLLELQKKWKQAVVHSKEAFVIKDRQLHAEGIDYDPREKIFYLGSIHKRKIIKVKEGVVTDFCQSGVDGLTSTLGIKVDVKQNVLWASSSPMPEMKNYDTLTRSAVFKFDLSSGKVLKKYELPHPYKTSVFGDLILDKNGKPYISDSKNNIVWTLNLKTDQLEIFYTSKEFWNIQGIAFNESESQLFISDYIKGVFKLDVARKQLISVGASEEVSLKGIDGIYFYKESLLAIQNGVVPLRSTRYYLNSKQDAITSYKIIDRAHVAFNEPTLGVIVGKNFYYIANSQWGGYDQNSKIKPSEQLQDIIILKYHIDGL